MMQSACPHDPQDLEPVLQADPGEVHQIFASCGKCGALLGKGVPLIDLFEQSRAALAEE